jgi:tRNA pseudouridine38-40 synthase
LNLSDTVRYKGVLSYAGIGFCGSQVQAGDVRTVFGLVESVLSSLLNQCVRCVPAGRTDSGVSASCMVFHMDSPASFNVSPIIRSVNRHLKSSGIIIRALEKTVSDFHAIASATLRTYTYFFTFDARIPHYLLHAVAYIDRSPLFIPTESEIASIFCGTKNFEWLSAKSNAPSTIRSIQSITFDEMTYNGLWYQPCVIYRFTISASGFLYRMVRNITGLLLHSMVNFTNMSKLRDYLCIHRVVRYRLAPAQGLHLTDIVY